MTGALGGFHFEVSGRVSTSKQQPPDRTLPCVILCSLPHKCLCRTITMQQMLAERFYRHYALIGSCFYCEAIPAQETPLKVSDHLLFASQVQGVYFRKHTVDKAKALRLVGWVANSVRGTVVGECQGPVEQLEYMKVWFMQSRCFSALSIHCFSAVLAAAVLW